MSEDQDDHPIPPSPSSGCSQVQAGEAPSPDAPNGDGVPSTSPERSLMASGEAPPVPLGNSEPGGAPVPTSPGIPQKLNTGEGPPLDATQPSGGHLHLLAQWAKEDAAKPDPGFDADFAEMAPTKPLSGWPWRAEDDALLRRRWHERGGAAAIGRDLGRTRNAVIGRANRLGLAAPRRLTEERRKSSAEAAAERQRQAKRVAAARARERERAHKEELAAATRPPNLVVAPKRDDTPGPDACELLDFTNRTCRFPLGELRDPVRWFCGVPEADVAAGVPYCREHSALCYTEPAPRRRT
jgi:GcrA cell cycle regulator